MTDTQMSISLSAEDIASLKNLSSYGYTYETATMDDGVTYLRLAHKLHDVSLSIVKVSDGFYHVVQDGKALAIGASVEAVCQELRRLLEE
jgi:hypothetical protein